MRLNRRYRLGAENHAWPFSCCLPLPSCRLAQAGAAAVWTPKAAIRIAGPASTTITGMRNSGDCGARPRHGPKLDAAWMRQHGRKAVKAKYGLTMDGRERQALRPFWRNALLPSGELRCH